MYIYIYIYIGVQIVRCKEQNDTISNIKKKIKNAIV